MEKNEIYDEEIYDEEIQRVDNKSLLLKNLIDRFEYSYNLLTSNNEESYYKKPFLYVEDFIYFKENYELMIGSEDFNNFQKNYCTQLLSMIKRAISDDYIYDLQMDTDGYYYIKVYYLNRYNNLFILYPLTRIIYIVENQYRKEIIEKINICELNINELRENEKLLIMSKKNPLISSESPVEMLKMSLNKKKYIMKFDNSLKQNDNNINEYYNQLAEYKSELEDIDNFESCLDLNRENFLLDMKKSNLEFYLSEENNQENNQENPPNNDASEKENSIDDITFFE